MSINKYIATGRLTRDPEIRATKDNRQLCCFTLAVDNRTKEPSAVFVPCVVYDRNAEFTANYVRKGSLIGIVGRLNQREYTNANGENVKVFEIVCDSVELLESKKTSEVVDTVEKPKTTFTANDIPQPEDDDLPF